MKLWELREKPTKHYRSMTGSGNAPMHRKMYREEDDFEEDEDFELDDKMEMCYKEGFKEGYKEAMKDLKKKFM